MTTRATYVCMVITCSKSQDQPGKVVNPASGQLKRENEYLSLSPFAVDTVFVCRQVQQQRSSIQ